MTRDECGLVVERLLAIWPAELTQQHIEGYWWVLESLETADVYRAIESLAKEGRTFLPKGPELYRRSKEIAMALPSWADVEAQLAYMLTLTPQWVHGGEVRRDRDEYLEQLHPLVQFFARQNKHVLRHWGPDDTWTNAELRRKWEALAERELTGRAELEAQVATAKLLKDIDARELEQ